jgi:spore germination protein YaaH
LPPGEAASPAAEPAVAQNPLASPEVVELPEPARVAAPRGIMAYILEPGDTLESLARRFGTSVERLRAMNKLAADRQLGPDDEIIVPAAGAISLN